MAVNFSTLVYLPCFDLFARKIVVTPVASQPGLPPFENRAIYDTRAIDLAALDGSIVDEQETFLDLLEAEWPRMVDPLDQIYIPPDPDAGNIGVGTYDVTSVDTNGGGLTTIVIRRIMDPKPVPS
jgi:hypothetical protein